MQTLRSALTLALRELEERLQRVCAGRQHEDERRGGRRLGEAARQVEGGRLDEAPPEPRHDEVLQRRQDLSRETGGWFIVRSLFRAKHHVVVQYMARWMKCPLPPSRSPPPQPPTPKPPNP